MSLEGLPREVKAVCRQRESKLSRTWGPALIGVLGWSALRFHG